MSDNLPAVEHLLKELKAEWSKKSPSLKKCGPMLEKLKKEITLMRFLPTCNCTNVSVTELLLARSILEIAVEYSIATKDLPAFERYISQLKCYYYDYRKRMVDSTQMYHLLGAYLLYLLCFNRVSEFHTELERFSPEVLLSNKYIQPVLALEQYIMEGRYNKIFQMKSAAPTELYNYFMSILMNTVRNEIGECIEKAYKRISVKDAAKRLNFKSSEDMRAFKDKRGWHLTRDGYYDFTVNSQKLTPEEIPSMELAATVLHYARNLEMIV